MAEQRCKVESEKNNGKIKDGRKATCAIPEERSMAIAEVQRETKVQGVETGTWSYNHGEGILQGAMGKAIYGPTTGTLFLSEGKEKGGRNCRTVDSHI